MSNDITYSGTFTPYGAAILNAGNSNATLSVHGDMEFTKSESYLQSGENTVAVNDIIIMTKLFKRMITDIANDPILAKRLPYVADAAHEWLLNDLKK